MEPQIEKSAFGWIVVAGHKYKHDIVLNDDGTIRKRNKKLSKSEYGTSHKVSLSEAQDIYQVGMTRLLIGSGMFDSVRLSDEAEAYFADKQVEVFILPTHKAIKFWNETQNNLIGVFHITC